MKEFTYALLNISTPLAVRELPLAEWRTATIRRFHQIGSYPNPHQPPPKK